VLQSEGTPNFSWPSAHHKFSPNFSDFLFMQSFISRIFSGKAYA
jgi:hypothetical protein